MHLQRTPFPSVASAHSIFLPLSDFLHLFHTVPAQDVHRLCSPHRKPTAGAYQFAGAGWPLTSWGAPGPCLGRSSGPCAYLWEGAPAKGDFTPALFKRVFHQVVPRRGVPAIRATGDTGQSYLFGLGLETLIMILSTTRHLFNSVFSAKNMHHFMS